MYQHAHAELHARAEARTHAHMVTCERASPASQKRFRFMV